MRRLVRDLDAWNEIGLFALAVATLAAALVYWSQRQVIALQKQEASDKAEAFEKYKKESDLRMTVANEGIALANARAEEAKAESAQANERAAQAQLELEKLKAAQAPWDFSGEKRAIFVKSLRSQPRGKILIMYTSADGTRASDFADALNRVLKTELGFDVWGYIGPFTSAGPSPLVGIELSMTDDSSRSLRDALGAAFQNIGIDTRLAKGSGTASEANQVVIAIGIKPSKR